jgi:hypothetical protein
VNASNCETSVYSSLKAEETERIIVRAAEEIWKECRGLGLTLSSELAVKRIRHKIHELIAEARKGDAKLHRELTLHHDKVIKLKQKISEITCLANAMKKELAIHGLDGHFTVAGDHSVRSAGPPTPPAAPGNEAPGREPDVGKLPAEKA